MFSPSVALLTSVVTPYLPSNPAATGTDRQSPQRSSHTAAVSVARTQGQRKCNHGHDSSRFCTWSAGATGIICPPHRLSYRSNSTSSVKAPLEAKEPRHRECSHFARPAGSQAPERGPHLGVLPRAGAGALRAPTREVPPSRGLHEAAIPSWTQQPRLETEQADSPGAGMVAERGLSVRAAESG